MARYPHHRPLDQDSRHRLFRRCRTVRSLALNLFHY
jgi:hypothetical protein